MPHPLSTPCWTCGAPTKSPQLDLDKRLERVIPAKPETGLPTTLRIISSERVLAFCGHPCWAASAVTIAASLELRETFPHGTIAPCSRCGTPVDRSKPYLCYALVEMVYTLTEADMARCIDDHTWAILCNDSCGAPSNSRAAETVPTKLRTTERIFSWDAARGGM